MKPEISALVSLNDFKGTLTNKEATDIVSRALTKLGVKTTSLPVGDGGRGTVDCVKQIMGGDFEKFSVSGPISQKVTARVLLLPNRKKPVRAYIESAETCGYHLVPEAERNVLRSTSYGLGELIAAVLSENKSTLKEIYIGLGDSITSDCGMGMLAALGFSFIGKTGTSLWANADGLRQIASINVPKAQPWNDVKVTALCDVLNPLCGAQGSANVFAPQKGAGAGQVALISEGMENFAALANESTGKSIRGTPMTGSAGGIAAACMALLNAKLVLGAQFLLDWIHYDDILQSHDLVITGEGRIDSQTLSGKAPYECFQRSLRARKKTLFFCGVLGTGHDALLRNSSVIGCFESGAVPTAKEALHKKTVEVFSGSQIWESLLPSRTSKLVNSRTKLKA